MRCEWVCVGSPDVFLFGLGFGDDRMQNRSRAVGSARFFSVAHLPNLRRMRTACLRLTRYAATSARIIKKRQNQAENVAVSRLLFPDSKRRGIVRRMVF